jgi:hypothetical protein
MKRPYKINFHTSILSDHNVIYNLPEYCLYPIPFAHAKQIVIPQITLLSQYSSTYLSYAELFEMQVEEAFTANVEILDQQLFLFFMFEGSISSKDGDGQEVLYIQGGNFCAGYKQKGNYKIEFKSGTHRFLVIAYRHGWSKRIAIDYPYLEDFFKTFQEVFWFSISENGAALESYMGKFSEEQNPAGCQELENALCAVAFTASELIDPNSEPQNIEDLKPEVLADPLGSTNIIRYKE